METNNEQLIVVTTLSQLEDLTDKLSEAEYVAYDVETTGVEKDSSIIGISVSWSCDCGYYVVLSRWDLEQQKLVQFETIDGIRAFLETVKKKKLIMHNSPFDCFMTNNNFGIELMPSVHTDTMIAGHLLDENRRNGLKELAVSLFGENSAEEQKLMKKSVYKNGGVLTKENYELYKADWELMARYGAKDAVLTYKLFCVFVEQIFEQKLDQFFYKDESMPLLRGPTYDMNTEGLQIDPVKLQKLRGELEVECMEANAFINAEIKQLVVEKYPGTGKTNHFNIDAPKQLAWLLFDRLGNEFNVLTKEGKALCKKLNFKLPYTAAAKRELIQILKERKGEVYEQAYTNSRTGKKSREKKIGDYWNYLACGKESITKLSKKYRWCDRLLSYKKADKLLKTYVLGIQARMRYGIIRPSFFQHGTTSGRYSCKNPNFQNLPRDDKRIKACVVSRRGKVFVGADYSQLEPRVFASYSKDERLLRCFRDGDDFYSVIGVDTFNKKGCSLKKDDKDSFANLYPDLRFASKTFGLAAAYGTTAFKMAPTLKMSTDDTQEIINTYFRNFPGVRERMLWSHNEIKTQGYITNLYGRPRRIPKAMLIPELFGANVKHSDLPYEWRNLLNLAMNHPIQSTAASIVNRAAIAICAARDKLIEHDNKWKEVKIVLQVHDEVVLEGPEELKEDMKVILKHCMETTCELPGVDLIAEPKAGYSLAELK